VKETSKAYLAGLMDADGTYTITSCIHNTLGHRLYDPTISCTSTYKPTLKWILNNFGGTIYDHKINGTSKLPRFDWVTQNYKHSFKVLSFIEVYVLQKNKQLNILKEFYSLFRQQCPKKRQSLYDSITYINAQIPVTTNTQVSWPKNLINAYFAGFFDGEATVGYTNYGTTSRISLGNTNLPLLNLLKENYGGKISPMGGKSRSKYRKPMWQWSLCKMNDVEKFILQILPYSKTKKKEAKELLNFLRNKMKIESELIDDNKI